MLFYEISRRFTEFSPESRCSLSLAGVESLQLIVHRQTVNGIAKNTRVLVSDISVNRKIGIIRKPDLANIAIHCLNMITEHYSVSDLTRISWKIDFSTRKIYECVTDIPPACPIMNYHIRDKSIPPHPILQRGILAARCVVVADPDEVRAVGDVTVLKTPEADCFLPTWQPSDDISLQEILANILRPKRLTRIDFPDGNLATVDFRNSVVQIEHDEWFYYNGL